MLLQSSNPVPLKFRIAAMVVAAVLALALLPLWAGGVRFMKLVTHVAEQVAAHETAKAEEAAAKSEAEAPPEPPGVVSVGILPAKP